MRGLEDECRRAAGCDSVGIDVTGTTVRFSLREARPGGTESQFALRGGGAVRAAGGLLRIGELWRPNAAVACCLFASWRFDRSSPSSSDNYFGQGWVVLILTLAPPGAVAHGVL